MKSVGLFISIILLIGTSAMGQQQQQSNGSRTQNPNTELPFPSKPNALIICAGDVPPDDMVITATGTSVTCAGSCRSRQIEPVDGPVMVICADQADPQVLRDSKRYHRTRLQLHCRPGQRLRNQARHRRADSDSRSADVSLARQQQVSRKTVCLNSDAPPTLSENLPA